jgi:hypothetical protein
VSVLLHANANPRIRGGQCKLGFPLTLATINDHIGIISILGPSSWSAIDQNRASIYSIYDSPVLSSMSAAAEKNKAKILEVLLSQAPKSFDLQASMNVRVFEEAFVNGHVPIAEKSVELRFNLSRPTSTYREFPTALGCAVKAQQIPMVKFSKVDSILLVLFLIIRVAILSLVNSKGGYTTTILID